MNEAISILLPASAAFFIGIIGAPFLTHFLYKHKMWKQSSVMLTSDGLPATISKA